MHITAYMHVDFRKFFQNIISSISLAEKKESVYDNDSKINIFKS